jgi:GntR family transcriptional regulator
MHIQIQPSDELPIYKQIVSQVREGIASGRIEPGEKLPSHRELAQRLVIAPLTVKKAYDMLELENAIETRRGQGTFVSATQPVASQEDLKDRFRAAVRRLLTDAWASGMSLEELNGLIQEEHDLAQAERQSNTKEEESR